MSLSLPKLALLNKVSVCTDADLVDFHVTQRHLVNVLTCLKVTLVVIDGK